MKIAIHLRVSTSKSYLVYYYILISTTDVLAHCTKITAFASGRHSSDYLKISRSPEVCIVYQRYKKIKIKPSLKIKRNNIPVIFLGGDEASDIAEHLQARVQQLQLHCSATDKRADRRDLSRSRGSRGRHRWRRGSCRVGGGLHGWGWRRRLFLRLGLSLRLLSGRWFVCLRLLRLLRLGLLLVRLGLLLLRCGGGGGRWRVILAGESLVLTLQRQQVGDTLLDVFFARLPSRTQMK